MTAEKPERWLAETKTLEHPALDGSRSVGRYRKAAALIPSDRYQPNLKNRLDATTPVSSKTLNSSISVGWVG